MLTLLIGTDWVANRDHVLKRIAQDVSEKKDGCIFIVPELISHDTERRLSEVAGDTCSRFAEVLSFSRLANRVSEYDGSVIRPCLDNGGRLVAMASAVKQLHSKLKAYAAVETKPEFLSGLLDAVDEFKRCCITSTDLMEASHQAEGSLAQKLEELSLILESYDSVCARGKCDPRDQMTWLLQELEESDYGRQHIFYIDGFPDFTRQHLNIIKHLLCTAENVTVSLTSDAVESDAIAFAKASSTAAELKNYAERKGIPVDVQCVEDNAGLTLIRKYLLQGTIGSQKCSGLKIVRRETVLEECKTAAEIVLDRIYQGARFRDINVACTDISLYRNVLAMQFEKCGIPLYVSGTEEILEQPAITAVFSAIEAALGGFELHDMLQYLKSMLSPLDIDDCDLLENYALLWKINGKKWEQDWLNHPGGLNQKWTPGAERLLKKINCNRDKAVAPLIYLRDELLAAGNVGHQVRALYAFLERIQYSDRLSKQADILIKAGNGRDAQILNQLWDILLEALEQLHDVLGDTVWEAENFLRLLKLLVSQYNVGTIPSVLDAVSVGPMNTMRCQQCDHLIVLGAVEGAMPGYSGSAGILTDQERTFLRKIGIPLTGGAMDGLLAEFADIYGVFTSGRKSVVASCPGGEPSFVFKRLAMLAGEEIPVKDILGPARANPADVASYLLRFGADDIAQRLDLWPIYQELMYCRDHSLGRVMPENIKKLYGDELRLSASQVDRFALCRLAYFLQYGLFAQERKTVDIDPAEFGTYVHAVMEDTVREVMQLGGFHSVSMDQAVLIARKFSDLYAQEHFSDLETERLQYLFRRNWSELEWIVRELWDEMQSSEFNPVGFEVAFGDGCEIPPIDVSGSKLAAKLRGFVDRVDAWQKNHINYFRIVDYKTGKKDFDYCDVYNGYGLQMLLYLFALQDAQAEMIGSDPIPAGVQYFPARVPYVSADGSLSDDDADALRKKQWKRKGLILNDDDVLNAMDNSDLPVRMPYTRRKDGTLVGDLADRSQFETLKRYVFYKVGKMVDEIASGEVEPNPYTRGTAHNPCNYCPYGTVCHKLTVAGRRNYQSITDKQFWTDIEREVGDDGR